MNPIFSLDEYCFDTNYPSQGFPQNPPPKSQDRFSTVDISTRGAIDDMLSSYGSFYPEFISVDDAPLGERDSMTTHQHASSSSLDILRNYRQGSNTMNGERIVSYADSNESEPDGELSTEEVMRAAAAHFIQSSTRRDGDPFGLSLMGLTANEIKNVELASFLLSAAEKVTNRQYDRASNLLRQCHATSSVTGNPVQRVVYYFADALQERIERETGRLSSKRNGTTMTAEEVIEATLASHPLQLICHQTMPFSQVLQFTAVQSVLDNVTTAKRIHIIDLSIKHGLQWTILIQALATRTAYPVESLKISAIGVAEEVNAATGNRLSGFAESVGVPFEFETVIVPDMKDLEEGMFGVKTGEVVGIYSEFDMSSMIVKPESLENLMRVILKLKPCIMTVVDVEAKHNSPSFIGRFTEALFYFSAAFDCLDSVMGRSDGDRLALEGSFYSEGIRSIVAREGRERVVRHVGVSVWREFFARFGIGEVELNEYSVYQGGLLLKQFVNGDSCTIEKDGKSLIVGWRGVPMHFVSAWKIQIQKRE